MKHVRIKELFFKEEECFLFYFKNYFLNRINYGKLL